MKALRIAQHGPVAQLAVTEVDAPPLGPDEVRVRVEAAGVNPSDVASAAGAFPGSPLPRILGRDFAGTIVEGPADLVGTPVWGSGGDLGIARDGTHAETLVIPRAAIARRPSTLSAEEAAAVGVPFVTAWAALDAARLAKGESVIVSGAAGAVGGAAIQLARARGAGAIALVRDEAEAKRIRADEVLAVARSDKGDAIEVARAATGGRGCDVALDAVGAAIFDALYGALADGGRMVVFSAATGREATLDLFALYRRRLSLLGLNTAAYDVVRCAETFRALAPLFESGTLRAPTIGARYPLAEAREAYAAAQRGGGKVVLTMG